MKEVKIINRNIEGFGLIGTLTGKGNGILYEVNLPNIGNRMFTKSEMQDVIEEKFIEIVKDEHKPAVKKEVTVTVKATVKKAGKLPTVKTKKSK